MARFAAAINALRFGITAIVFLGAVAPGATTGFFFSNPMMPVLAVVDLLALIMLFPIAKRLLIDFRDQLKAGLVWPMFYPAKFSGVDIDRTA